MINLKTYECLPNKQKLCFSFHRHFKDISFGNSLLPLIYLFQLLVDEKPSGSCHGGVHNETYDARIIVFCAADQARLTVKLFYASISPSRIARIKLAKMKYVLSSVHKGNTIKQHGVKWLCENYYT